MGSPALPFYIAAPGTPSLPPPVNVPPVSPLDGAPSLEDFKATQRLTPPTISAPMNMGDGMPAVSAPVLPNAQPNQVMTDQSRLSMLRNTGSGIDQIHNPFLRGLARAGDITASLFEPRLATLIPGTSLHHNMLVDQAQQNLANDQAANLQQANLARTQAGTRLTNDQAAIAESPSTPDYAYVDTPQGKVGILKGTTNATPVTGPDGKQVPGKMPDMQHIITDTGIYSFNPQTSEAHQLTGPDGKPLAAPQKLQESQPIIGSDGKPHTFMLDNQGNKVVDLGVHYEKPNVTNVNEGTWSVQTDTSGNPILLNSKTGETKAAPANLARKPNAEEQKRADLAQNVNENLDKLTDIVTRRPDLFGPVAGRATSLRQMIGTSDPDVATLKTLEDNLGMAMQSAHGMRSAQHVETSAQSVLNGMKNSPQALKAAIQTARDSVGTFQKDVQNTNTAGKPSDTPTAMPSHSLKTAMALPFNQGKTADQVKADLTAHGYTVVP